MTNPGGNYPGRQPWVGATKEGKPAWVYLVTGRSEPSQQRIATAYLFGEDAIRINPVKRSTPHDRFRHYQAVRITPSGVAVISNSQAPQDMLIERYECISPAERAAAGNVERVLAAAGPEYDNAKNPTPRVVGVVFPLGKDLFDATLGVTKELDKAFERIVFPSADPGKFSYVQTYDGNVEYGPFDERLLLDEKTDVELESTDPQGLADEVYAKTDYIDPKYGDLRVCAVAGVFNGNGPGGWEIRRKNRHRMQESD